GGSGNKPILVRVIGPTLGGFGVAGVAPDPAFDVITGGTVTANNDNWAPALAATFDSVGAFPLNADSADAALAHNLPGGPHSVRLYSKGQNGIVLVDAYDLEAVDSGPARLVNVSARNQIGTGGNVLVAGFVIGGSGGKTVLIRGVGATLGDFGVNAVLANPVLEVHRQITGGSELVAQNDDWNGHAEIATVAQCVGAV